MKLHAGFAWLAVVLALVSGSTQVHAENYNALRECIRVSPNVDDIHACMDNYLDIMDATLDDMNDYLLSALEGEARQGLIRSQQAFIAYRKENCLWYLEFSTPREEAEQIAKNCLATMSQQRLMELRALLSAGAVQGAAVSGFYVYGAERNSFQPCGGTSRYWLEGSSAAVAGVQQSYLANISSDLQILFATLVGTIDEQAEVPAGHDGVFKLESMIEMRVPTDADCSLSAERDGRSDESGTPVASVSAENVADQVEEEQSQADLQLTAYFGAWTAECSVQDAVRSCRLSVAFAGNRNEPPVSLIVTRMRGQMTSLELVFAEREIDSPSRVRWQVDAMHFGDIVEAEIRVDQDGTRLLVPAGAFLRNELFPMMIEGTQVKIEILESVDDGSGVAYLGTLMGLTKAIRFADEFVQDDGS